MPSAMQEVRPDEHNGPSGLRIYAVYQILQKVLSMHRRNMKIKHIVTVMLYVKWGSKTKHCKLVRGYFLFTEAYLYIRQM